MREALRGNRDDVGIGGLDGREVSKWGSSQGEPAGAGASGICSPECDDGSIGSSVGRSVDSDGVHI